MFCRYIEMTWLFYSSGSLIGTGGRAIRDMMEITGADIHISGLENVYPGTADRVVYIKGKFIL